MPEARERHRDTQRRYREKKQRSQLELVTAVAHLTEDTRRLEALRARLLPAQVRSYDAAMSTAREFIRVFEVGVQPPPGRTNQFAFFHSVTAPDFAFMDDADGAAVFFRQWAVYEQTFASSRVVALHAGVIRLETDDDVIVRAPTTMHLRLSRVSMTTIYPSLSDDDATLDRLVGRDLVVPMLCVFYVNKATSRIQRFSIEADVAAAALQLLENNVQAAARALEHSRLQTTAKIAVDPTN
ncbi:hypothetical protein SPRG_03885 [Saprolegnia parasitica CBS 223.65]|uniref:BZIP domain-containing protein n=1 Tax=Saprolegnia parasitica (strain CBS 223.65) TaxID=695850 RepID=A0A067CPW1_SAPPC|nr:hypothetical protein SPRG_03885 [Saprolegnia parasitica CBS 223.65]KDO31270.1 hypothetical protein SPRG_03885 [Saprolegnia parasitica CBS 223.65]|eukprot:XP_012197869.1 hypothetical protein SPRG_03885 [Saprolegnia parasitica CBS 223.65]